MHLDEILGEIQAALGESGLDGWLFYDHHHRDPIAYRVLGLDENMFVSRRWFYFLPAEGEPQKLVHRIEASRLDAIPGRRREYSSWQELDAGLDAMLAGRRRIAMQYSPGNAIPYVSMVDAGTVDALRALGKEVVSSADLVSRFEAVLTAEQIASHQAAQKKLDAILPEAFAEIGRALRPAAGAARRLREYDMVAWFHRAFEREGLTTDHGPDVSVNANTSDSHYEATAEGSAEIRGGDFLLIDVWARQQQADSIWYDITWTGVIGRQPTEREQLVFATVREARDAAISAIAAAFRAGEPIYGWQGDEAAREVIGRAGFGPYFTHRTGHNIARSLHGSGAHLDNFETHDERRILARTCFSVEPGIYLPEFGVRSEVNMITSARDAVVTGRLQTELVRV